MLADLVDAPANSFTMPLENSGKPCGMLMVGSLASG
jgi:hypothetical protein